MKEQRRYLALRAHIDELIQSGGRILSREPLTLRANGNLYTIAHGMLISYIAAA